MSARLALTWLVSMSWHLWRIGTGRPAFSFLADDGRTILSFGGAFIAAGFLRHWALGEMDLSSTLVGMSLYCAGLLVMFERSDRASTLVAAAMGASATVDLVAGAAMMLGINSQESSWWWTYIHIEFALIAWTYFRFKAEPSHVQARGYGRKPAKA